MNRQTRITLTMGDPCGIGPEIIVTLFASSDMADTPAFVIGDAGILRREVERLQADLVVREISEPETHTPADGMIDVIPVSALDPALPYGEIRADAGRAAYDYIACAIRMAMARRIHGICTAPIHKEALHAAGVPYPGHTEILAAQSGTTDYAMMLASPELRTMLVTVHCSLLDAVHRITADEELRIIRLADATLKKMGIGKPRIAVAGLNPHAGEGGMFGREDIDIIAPAIRRAREEGIDASGPHPGDTVFMRARLGHFDLVVAQYHDQGLIPIKLLGVQHGVNITAGLPFIRTSPDHGTAFDIAGKGIADEASLRYALKTAFDLANVSAKEQ